jgi:hypothetical protein
MSPAFKLSPPAAASTTSQQNSWPITVAADGSSATSLNGSGGADSASSAASRNCSAPCCSMCKSLPQMPHASTLASTWPGPGTGSGTSSTESFQSRITVARTRLNLDDPTRHLIARIPGHPVPQA